MGFRSTFISADIAIEWPRWFEKKWRDSVHFRYRASGQIASRNEGKCYGVWKDLPGDIQTVLSQNSVRSVVLVFLHECGGITRYEISATEIKTTEPSSWRHTDGVTHNYCYGCSDAPSHAI